MNNNRIDNFEKWVNHFLTNELFICWATNPTEELELFWKDFITNNPTLKEPFRAATKEFGKLQQSNDSFKGDKRTIRRRVLKSTKSRGGGVRLRWIASVAALLLVVGSASFYFGLKLGQEEEVLYGETTKDDEVQLFLDNSVVQVKDNATLDFSSTRDRAIIKESDSQKEVELGKTKQHKVVTPYGKRSSLILVDGTKLWLNSGTTVEFPSAFVGGVREIKVVGEAFLEVSENKEQPFVVRTPHSAVTVLGTSFNVTAYEGESREAVVLVEGSVRVSSKDRELLLEPSQRALLTEQGITAERVDVSEYISWKSGYLVFNQAPLKEVFEAVSRYYNVRFSSTGELGIGERSCSGKLYLSDSFDDLLEVLSAMTLYDYDWRENTVYIKKPKPK